MDLRLTGRRALFTGSSAGVGAAIARQLAAKGCRVIVHGRQEGPAVEQAEVIRRAGGSAKFSWAMCRSAVSQKGSQQLRSKGGR